ncbi:MAG: hypothetical protein A2Y02_02345 [Omnitrophica bacterium GWA2_52_12]|nr:MAG: hypothetical protein A2Y02_02345 [Omnitrophica bacterium GWA2_52_12]
MFRKIKQVTLASSLLLFSGCAAMPFLNGPQHKALEAMPGLPPGYLDYSGVVHVHTLYSHHSTGGFDEVVKSAERAHVDFVVITDHDNLRWLKENKEGFHGDVLVLVGTELSTPAGHLSVFGVENEINIRQETRKILKEVQKSGASSFICHAQLKLNPWTDWALRPMVTGMEVFNLPAEIYADGYFKIGLKSFLYSPRHLMFSYVKRPDAALKQWDEILVERKFVGIGAADAHQRFRFLGVALDSYDAMFETVQTHALAKDFSRQGIFEAFKKGHVYIGFDVVKPIRNFFFEALTAKGRVMMGESVKFHKGLKLRVFLPEEARIKVLKNGKEWKSVTGEQWEGEADGFGVYRVEVYLNDKIWIISNPIYVR